MPHEITLTDLPGGFAATSSAKGEAVKVIRREFTSSEDGDLFISRLEGLPRMLLSNIPNFTLADEGRIGEMLAVVRADRTTTIYINEIESTFLARVKNAVKKGDWITYDQILDIDRLTFKNISIADTDGLVLVFSCGWRKGLFFDLMPLPPGNEKRDYDLGQALGFFVSYLHFQHLFSIPNSVWDEFSCQDWFPFIHLRQATLKRMIAVAKEKQFIDGLLEEISIEVESEITNRIAFWSKHPVLKTHFKFIESAFRHFKNKDFLSASAILYPRIEGVMRSHHFSDPSAPKASQENLIHSVISKAPVPSHKNSLMLPEKFSRFLSTKYFAKFDPTSPKVLSRNTISHGVAPEALFDQKGACLGFLILLQLISLLPTNVELVPSTAP